jgi:hypothetical protein
MNQMKMKRKIQLAFCTVLPLLIVGCAQNPRITITPSIVNDRVVFNLTTSGINGILGVEVRDANGTLWEIRTSYEKGNRIVYGELPTGGNMAARQTFPPPGTAPKGIRGKTVTVRIDYQYDQWISACAGDVEKVLVIPLIKKKIERAGKP